MKKSSVIVLVFLFIFVISFTLAANETNSTSGTNTNLDGVSKAYTCLEGKVNDCSGLTTQEVALTILAGPEKIYQSCVNELNKRKTGNNWGNIRDTALATLALEHAGENTNDSETWLLTKTKIPTDLIWYLEEDSDGITKCNINYNSNSYSVNVGEDKKIDADAGTCLTRAQSNFWLKVNPSCYESEFTISCDKDFITALLYKNSNSQTIYVLEGTQEASALGTTNVKINSKCFGETSCEYEASAWATIALLKTGHDVEEFIPYIIAMADTNKKYLPNSFIYSVTGYEDYATQLVAEQKLGNFWQADSTAYNKFYDTSLALISVGSSSSEQVRKAKEWLLFSQDSNGCWQNSVRDTAIALWALEGRPGKTSTGSSITTCSQGGFSCVQRGECQTSQIKNNYYCSITSTVCCETEIIKKCSEYGGNVCKTGEVCIGNEKKATDVSACCTGVCQERKTTEEKNECEDNGGSCYPACEENEEEKDYSCEDSEKVCCIPKEDGGEETSSSKGWLVWVLVIGITMLIIAILYVYREKLKLAWFGARSKFRRDSGRPGFGGPTGPRPPAIPPRPGFPPIRRPMPVAQANRPRPVVRDRQMNETFRKLNEMSR